MSIISHDELDFKKINYSKPEKQGVIYYSSMNYDNKPFYLQTPKMICKNNHKEIEKNIKQLAKMCPKLFLCGRIVIKKRNVDYKKYYNDRNRKIIEKLYEEDLKQFKYTF